MAGVGLMTISLVACANEQEVAVLGDSAQTQNTMQQNGVQTIEQSQFAEKCEEYELQPDGSYKCDNDDDDDYSGSGAGMFWFFNGHTYSSHNAMVASSDYKKNNVSTGTSTKKSSSSKDANQSKNKNQVKTNKSGAGSSNPKSSSGGKSSGFGGGAKGGSSGGS